MQEFSKEGIVIIANESNLIKAHLLCDIVRSATGGRDE
jgi:hypothetical protein